MCELTRWCAGWFCSGNDACTETFAPGTAAGGLTAPAAHRGPGTRLYGAQHINAVLQKSQKDQQHRPSKGCMQPASWRRQWLCGRVTDCVQRTFSKSGAASFSAVARSKAAFRPSRRSRVAAAPCPCEGQQKHGSSSMAAATTRQQESVAEGCSSGPMHAVATEERACSRRICSTGGAWSKGFHQHWSTQWQWRLLHHVMHFAAATNIVSQIKRCME